MTPKEMKLRTENLVKVNEWLDRICEYDKECRSEVIESCFNDKEAMNYYLSRYEEQ